MATERRPSVRRLPSAKWPSRPHINKERRASGVKQWPTGKPDGRTNGPSDERTLVIDLRRDRQRAWWMTSARCRRPALGPPGRLLPRHDDFSFGPPGSRLLACSLARYHYGSALHRQDFRPSARQRLTVSMLISGHRQRHSFYVHPLFRCWWSFPDRQQSCSRADSKLQVV